MGKNKRHQKDVRAERSKIQLKTKLTKTKFLPKGTNVTDVNFKIKPIVLREQLKSRTSDQFVTRNKHSLKEVLTRLNHYNTTMRSEACEGLIELIISTPIDVIEQHLNVILQGVSKLILDIERKVRQKGIKVLHVILEKVSRYKVVPFLDMLASYVSCAMTHIDKNIQEDSLLVIDVYLLYAPDLIVQNFDKLFSNFLTLISKLRSDSKLSRTLTVNLGSKLTSIKWRIKVLSRLQGILSAVNQTKKTNVTISNTINCPVIQCSGMKYIPLYRNIRTTYDLGPRTTTFVENKIETDYVKVLLPLLYETWAEAAPLDEIKYRENGVMLIDQDAASILSCVVGILYALFDFVNQSDSEHNLRKLLLSKENKLMNHFLNQFPYRQNEYRRKIEKELSKLLVINIEPKCVQENLLICYIFCVLYKTIPNNHYLKKAHEIIDYIGVCLSHRNYVPSNCIITMTLVLRLIFFENINYWQQKGLISDKLLDNVVNFNNNLPVDGEHRTYVFNLLADIAKVPEITKSHKFDKWLSDLPLLLLKPEISLNFVNTLSLLARQNNKTFLEALANHLSDFLDNLPNIKVTGDNLPPAHITLLNMLYYIPKLNRSQIQLLQVFVANNQDWIFVKQVELLLSKRC